MAKKPPHLPLIQIGAVCIFFIAVLVLYIHNVTHDVYSGDIGDLVTASYVFGVPHPSGYPLFTLLGFLFSHLPFPVPIVTRVGYISAIASFAGLFLFFLFTKRVTKNIFLSLLVTAVLAFSHYYWIYAEVPEVFGLNNFFIIALLVLSFLFYKTKDVKILYALGFVTGLSVAHHQTIIFIFPGALFLILQHSKLLLKKKTIILKGLLFFILGTLFYLYIPIAASHNPVVNWDDATNWKNFVHLFLRKDYQTIGSGSLPLFERFIILRNYAKSIADNFSYQIIFVMLLGVIMLFKKDKKMLTALLVTFLLSGPLFVMYIGSAATTSAAWGIIERFYTLSAVVLMFFVPYGFLLIKDTIDAITKKPLYSTVILMYFVIIPIFMVWYNFPKTNLSQTQIGNNLAKDVLIGLPRNSLLFVSGDTTTFNIWYVHYVLGVRPDIGIINPPGVGGTNYLDGELNKFKKAHPETKNSEIFTKTLDSLRTSKRIFGTYKFTYRPKGTMLVPKGRVYELMNINAIPSKEAYINEVEPRLHALHIARRETLLLSDTNLITSEIPLIYSNSFVAVGDFLMSYYKDNKTAEHYYRRALWIDDENPAGYAGLSLSLYKGYADCPGSIEQMKTAIEIYPIWNLYYKQLFELQKRCKADEKTLAELKKLYKSRFDKDINK